MEIYEKMGYPVKKTKGVNFMKTGKYILTLMLAATIGTLIFWQLDKYNRNNTIKIGFSGCLTGHLSDLGIGGRDAVILAVKEINAKGGVNGKKIKLIIKDDKNDPAAAVKADKELVSSGCIAIIGHMTSSISIADARVLFKSLSVWRSWLIKSDKC